MSSILEFDRLYAQLNDRQREAVDSIEGPVMVIAGPGTGKTKVLTLRIANILAKTDTPPEAILALTFSESGAVEMRSRLARMIGTQAYRVKVMTFHSFCNDIIQQHPESFPEIAGGLPMSEIDQLSVIENLIKDSPELELLRPVGAPLLYLKAIASALDTLKRENVSPEGLLTIIETGEAEIMAADDLYHMKGRYKGQMKGDYSDSLRQLSKLREFSSLYSGYRTALRERKSYDYNDMIMEVAGVLQKDELLRLMLQESNQYILIDEHQDTNNAQNFIIETLAAFWERPNLFVVGDARQAIYRFQGASLENFLYFQKLYPEVKLIELQDNYRSSQTILDAASGISGGALKSRTGHEDVPVSIMALHDEDTERYALTRHIQERLASGVRPEDIAIFYRDNADGQILSSLLDKLGLPYAISSDSDALDDADIRKVILLAEAVSGFGKPGPLFSALHVDVLKVDPLDIYKLVDFCRTGRNPYDVMRSPELMAQAGMGNSARLIDISAMMTRWRSEAHNQSAALTLATIVRESGMLDSILASAKATEKLSKLHALYGSVRMLVQRDRFATFLDFVEHLKFLREHKLSLRSNSTDMPGRLRLMTAHRSKGLEFDHVYITGAVDEHWGPRNRRELIKLPQAVFLKTNELELKTSEDDERNLFYVALTRARKTITLTMSRHDSSGRELLPCRFISDIKPELTNNMDVSSYESAWPSDKAINFAPETATSPDLSDKAFLNDMFFRQGLSATALNNYLECPWKYFYRNLVRIPEAPNFSLMYGSAVDRALQEYFERLREGEDRGKEYLISSFHRFARHQPFQDNEMTTAISRGQAALSGYFDARHSEWHSNVINQLKVPAVAVTLPSGVDINLSGKMDRVDIRNASNDVIVTDYKTGRAKSRREIMGQVKDGDGNYFRQLAFYKLLLDKYKNGHYRMAKGIIDFVDPDQKGAYRREEFVLDGEHVQELEKVIIRVAQEIIDLSFWDSGCGDRDCEYCSFRKLIR